MDSYKDAIQKIKNVQECKPKYAEKINMFGIVGAQRATGPTGPAPILLIGNVTTGAPGTNAQVTITPTT